MRKTVFLSVFLVLVFVSSSFANGYEITSIAPIFNEATPGFGKFKIEVKIESKRNQESKLNVCCLYIGLTRPGVYFKNEPQLMKQYKSVKIAPMSTITVIFEEGLRSYHPETIGEIIVSIVGSGVVRSKPLKTQFHPESDG